MSMKPKHLYIGRDKYISMGANPKVPKKNILKITKKEVVLMVQNLKTTNDANNGRTSINLDALGAAGTANIVGEKKEKPKLLEPVEARVLSTDIVMTDQLGTNRDDEDKKFFRGYVTYETEFVDPATGEKVTSKDSFGTLRFYLKLDETKSPMRNPDGSPVIERLWIGDKSGLGKLLKLVQEHDKNVVTYNDFLGYFKEGTRVKLLTLFNTYQGQQTYKQEIVEIL